MFELVFQWLKVGSLVFLRLQDNFYGLSGLTRSYVQLPGTLGLILKAVVAAQSHFKQSRSQLGWHVQTSVSVAQLRYNP